MESISQKARQYRLPNPTTSEDLGCYWEHVLNYGDKVLLAGYHYSLPGTSHYFAAIYEHLDNDRSCEGAIGLYAVSDVMFEDEGHAIQWAIKEACK